MCDPEILPPDIAPLLYSTLLKFSKLQTLIFDVDRSEVEHIKKSLLATPNLTFPTIKKVVLGPDSEFLPPLCPNATTIWNAPSNDCYNTKVSESLDIVAVALKAGS